MLYKSVRELANDTNVSTATVMRFCKKVGVKDFLEFKLQKVSLSKFNPFVPMVYATERIFYELTQNM